MNELQKLCVLRRGIKVFNLKVSEAKSELETNSENNPVLCYCLFLLYFLTEQICVNGKDCHDLF